MTKGPHPNPSDLRMILGNNLRQLCAEVTSISDLCRTIGVNRTQFNRYLTGTAFPRPDVLFRICSHFGVDANILLRPLDEIPSHAGTTPEKTAATLPLPERQRPFDHYMLPDGMYRYWRKSFRQPNRVYQGMAQIRTFGEATLWKGYDIHDGRCCRTLTVEDSHCESMRLDGRYEQATTRPLWHDELVPLHRLTEEAWVFADLAGQGDDLARVA